MSTDIHYFAQGSQIADCHYRAYLTSNYVAFFDLDEVITPLNGLNWLDFIPQNPKFVSYRIRNTHVGMYPDDINSNLTDHELVKLFPINALLHTKRMDIIEHPKDRSKWIGKPQFLDEIFVHGPNSLLKGREYVIPKTKAVLTHFKRSHNQGYGKVETELFSKYKEKMLEKLVVLKNNFRP